MTTDRLAAGRDFIVREGRLLERRPVEFETLRALRILRAYGR